jgi:hypothetical protein
MRPSALLIFLLVQRQTILLVNGEALQLNAQNGEIWESY